MPPRSCAACAFVAPAGVNPTSAEYHKRHRDHHLAEFPQSNATTIAALDRMVALAERNAFAAPSPEAA